MTVVSLRFMLFAAVWYKAFPIGHHSTFDQNSPAHVPFLCDSYQHVSQSLTLMTNAQETRTYSHMFEDDVVTKAEISDLLQLYCPVLSRQAAELESDYKDCPNAFTIRQSMRHLGPFCLASGKLSEFAKNLLNDFTEITTTADCSTDVSYATDICHVNDDVTISPSGYAQDLAKFKRIVKNRYRCVLKHLSTAEDCGRISDVQKAYLMIGSQVIIKPGFNYTLQDFF